MGLFLASLTIGLLAYAGIMVSSAIQERLERQPPNRTARERVYAVNVRVVEESSVVPIISSFGEVRSLRTLEVRAPVGGLIIKLSPNFVEGGVFEEGEFMLAVDPSDALSVLDLAIADKQDAEVQLSDAKRALEIAQEELAAAERQADLRQQALDRQNTLRTRGVGTDIAVENAELSLSSAEQAYLTRKKAVAQAETRVEQSQSLVERREIRFKEAQRNFDETQLQAEFSGILSEVNLVRGGLVNPNERIAQLIDPDVLEVSFRVSSEQYSRILGADGKLQPLKLNVIGASLSARAEIVRESAIVADGQTGRLIFAAIEGGRRSGLRPGDFVEVRIEEDPLEGVLVLPAESVDTQQRLLVLDADNRLEEINAEILRKQGNEIIIQAENLAGRMVVTQRSPLIGSGIRVRPILPESVSIPEVPQDVALTDEERSELIALVEGNQFIPDAVKQRLLNTLQQELVPLATVDRLRGQMGG